MPDFIRKISAKMSLIIKTCSASGSPPPDTHFGALPPSPHQGLCPWTPGRIRGSGDFRPRPPNYLPRLSSSSRSRRNAARGTAGILRRWKPIPRVKETRKVMLPLLRLQRQNRICQQLHSNPIPA